MNQANENQYYGYFDPHSDYSQSLSTTDLTVCEGIVIQANPTGRIVGPTSEGTRPKVNGGVYPQQASSPSTGAQVWRALRVRADTGMKPVFVGTGDCSIVVAYAELPNLNGYISGVLENASVQNIYDIDVPDTLLDPAMEWPNANVDTFQTEPTLHSMSSIESVESGSWVDTGTVVVNGAFDASLTVPMSPHWMRIQVDIDGTRATQNSTCFGSGLVAMFSQQSNGVRMFLNGHNVYEPIGDIGHDFQYFRIVDCSNPSSGITGPVFITDSNQVAEGITSIAAAFHKNAPGLKVSTLWDVKSGIGQPTTLNDTNTARNWSNIPALVNTALPDGGDVGVFLATHVANTPITAVDYAKFFLGKNVDGSDIPEINKTGYFNEPTYPNMKHIWAEAMPGMLNGRTQIVTGDHSMSEKNYSANPTIQDAISMEGKRAERRLLEQNFPSIFSNAPHTGSVRLGDDPPFDDMNHLHRFSIHGAAYRGSLWASMALHKIGMPAFTPPVFDNFHWTPNYLEIWSSQGPVSTLERREAADELRNPLNFPDDTSATPSAPGNREVVGFHNRAMEPMMRTEIWAYDGSNNQANEGRIRIYPPAGETFDGNSRIYWNRTGVGRWRPDHEHDIVAHLPIIDVGLKGRNIKYGWQVLPFDDPETINASNNLTGIPEFNTSGTFFSSTTDNNSTVGPGVTSLRFEIVGTLDNLFGRAALCSANHQNFELDVSTTGAIRVRAFGTQIANTANDTIIAGKRFTLTAVIDIPNDTVKVTLDGVDVVNDTNAGFSGQGTFYASKPIEFLHSPVNGYLAEGTWESLKVWKNDPSGTGSAYHSIVGDSSAANADSWKTGPDSY